MSVVLAHPHGNPNSRAVARGLARVGSLERLHTAVAFPAALTAARWLPEGLARQLARRTFDGVPWEEVRLSPTRELARLLVTRTGPRSLIAHETGWASVDAVYRTIDLAVAASLGSPGNGKPSIVYAYEDGALESFRSARILGLRCCYDLPIAYWRATHRILEEERDRNPAWANTIDVLKDSPHKLARKDEELALAEDVFVASSFTAASLRMAPLPSPKQVHVVPYGAPLSALPGPGRRRPDEPLRIVFVGRLCQHKGISYLLDACARLGLACELTMIGPGPSEPNAAFRDAVGQHRWLRPISHAAVLRELPRHHVMVFPSLADGFGLVILEAMGCGLPVITTANTGGPDIIDNGLDGFIVPIRDPDAIAERLALLADDEPQRMAMAVAARRKAETLSWRRYEDRMVELLRSPLDDA